MQHCEIVNNDQKEAPQGEIVRANDQQNANLRNCNCEFSKRRHAERNCNKTLQKYGPQCETVKTSDQKYAALKLNNDQKETAGRNCKGK